MSVSPATEREVSSGEVRLAVSDSGSGVPVVLLHGLTATRRYVVMGSRALERTGHRVLAYDARGHGASPPGRLHVRGPGGRPGGGAGGERDRARRARRRLDGSAHGAVAGPARPRAGGRPGCHNPWLRPAHAR